MKTNSVVICDCDTSSGKSQDQTKPSREIILNEEESILSGNIFDAPKATPKSRNDQGLLQKADELYQQLQDIKAALQLDKEFFCQQSGGFSTPKANTPSRFKQLTGSLQKLKTSVLLSLRTPKSDAVDLKQSKKRLHSPKKENEGFLPKLCDESVNSIKWMEGREHSSNQSRGELDSCDML